MGYIGDDPEEITYEPIEEPSSAPAPAEPATPARQPEPVGAPS